MPFRGSQADVLLNPTTSVLLARQCLRQLRIGGSTPLADGLRQARRVVRCASQKQPGIEPLIVVISDGEANVPLVAGNDVYKELDAMADTMQREGAKTVVIDSSTGVLGNKFLKRFSHRLHGRYHHVRDPACRALIRLDSSGRSGMIVGESCPGGFFCRFFFPRSAGLVFDCLFSACFHH